MTDTTAPATVSITVDGQTIEAAKGELVIDAAFEQLRLVHEARDRRVFADGAISAAEWLQGRKGVFTMRDVLHLKEEAR